MKLFQKSALAVAIAAVPFLSVNAMEALDDAALSEMTGQAGVTIETQVDATGITIGSVEYTDTLATGETDGTGGVVGGGSLLIDGNVDGSNNGIRIRGWDTTTGTAVGSVSKQTIDINSSGDLITETVQIDGFGGADIATNSQRIEVGAVNLVNADRDAKVSLVSNLDMVITSGSSSAHILNTQGANATRDLSAYDIGATAGTVDASAADGNVAIITRSESRIDDLSVDALDGAIGISGLRYGGGANGTDLMESTQVIWANGGDASINADAGVFIQGSDSVGTLVIDSVSIGQGTIGSVKIANISQTGSTMRIYGH